MGEATSVTLSLAVHQRKPLLLRALPPFPPVDSDSPPKTSVQLKLLGQHWLITLYKLQVYNLIMQYLYTLLCAHTQSLTSQIIVHSPSVTSYLTSLPSLPSSPPPAQCILSFRDPRKMRLLKMIPRGLERMNNV